MRAVSHKWTVWTRVPPTYVDPAVAEVIESRGHVLLVHVGGTTVDEQPRDTNLRTRDSQDLEITYGLCMAGPGCDAGRLYSYVPDRR